MQSRFTRLLAIFLLIGLVTAAVPAIAAADTNDTEDDSPLDELLNSSDEDQEEPDGIIDWARQGAADRFDSAKSMVAFIDGKLKRTVPALDTFSEQPTNEELGNEFASAVEEDEDTFTTLFTEETTPRESYDTHRFTFAHEDSEAFTVYLVSNITENESVDDIAVLSQKEFDETNRDVDEEWVIMSELATSIDTLVSDIAVHYRSESGFDKQYASQKAGQFCDVSNPLSGNAVEKDSCDARSTMWLDRDQVYDGVDSEHADAEN